MGRPTGDSVGSTSTHSPIVAVEAKKADVVPVAMVAMEPMAAPYAAHADRAVAVTGGVTSPPM
jgi:hypothetical protein